MVWLNTEHSNEVPAPGVFGGSRCTCAKCANKRKEASMIKTIQRQMANAANELDILNSMLGRWPRKQRELRGASDMLGDWVIEIGNDQELIKEKHK